MERFDHMVKILLIGESGVGKTCVLHKFNSGEFQVNHLTTIAIDFKVKYFDIWDTAGQERFHTLTQGFFNGAQGIVVVYSITDEKSFQRVSHWMDQIKETAPENIQVVLIGNKADLEEERVVSKQQGQMFADKHGIPFFETSAYNGHLIEDTFQKLATMILDNLGEVGTKGEGLVTSRKQNSCCK